MRDLDELFHDAVSDVEPGHRLPAIQARTRRRARRPWLAAGAALAVAAVVVGVAVLPRVLPSDRDAPVATPTPVTHAVAVYYLGDTPEGPRLFREFHRLTGPATLDQALGQLSEPADDPDYRTHWVPGGLAPARIRDGVIEVEVVAGSVAHARDGVSPQEAELSVQQAVMTVQAAAGRPLPVRFVSDGVPVDDVYGVPTPGPVEAAREVDVLAHVSVSDPGEGRVVSGSFSADGRAWSFEGSVPWSLTSVATGEVVLQGTAQGRYAFHLTPWSTGPIDVSDLPPGDYLFTASTDDASVEPPGPTTDTRTVHVS